MTADANLSLAFLITAISCTIVLHIQAQVSIIMFLYNLLFLYVQRIQEPPPRLFSY